jgi:hypothetical protein
MSRRYSLQVLNAIEWRCLTIALTCRRPRRTGAGQVQRVLGGRATAGPKERTLAFHFRSNRTAVAATWNRAHSSRRSSVT